MLKQASPRAIGMAAAALYLAAGVGLHDAAALTPNELKPGPPSPALSDLDRQLLDDPRLGRLYEPRAFLPVWLDASQSRLSQQGKVVVRTLAGAAQEGLDPARYRVAAIEAALTAGRWRDLDVLISTGLLTYLDDVTNGRPEVRARGADLRGGATPTDAVVLFRDLLIADDFEAALGAAVPTHPQYRRLRETLAQLRQRAAAGGWPTVPDGETLDPGMRDSRVAALRARLAATEGVALDVAEPAHFDPALEAAVRQFQQRHGLAVDGRVGRNTLAALNRSVGELIEVVQANMERWRWLPHDLGDRYILVNTAGYRMEVVENRQSVLRMAVVTGMPSRPTPMFSAPMRYLEVNPTWTVPPTIFAKDYLPKLREDPGYLWKQRITLYASWSANAVPIDPYLVDWHAVKASTRSLPYRLVQSPGPHNALGRIKFMLPNRHSIYLHDTPHRELFSRARRALSSGCIRLARPDELADLILKDAPGWDRERLDRTYASGETTRVPLARTWPVHIVYFTAWVDDEGEARFYDDVYRRDEALLRLLHENDLLLAEEPHKASEKS